LTEHSKAISEDLRAHLLELLPQLRRFARSLTGNRDDGDDLMQATVEKILRKGMPADATPRAWLFTVCKNLFLDERRAQAVRTKAAQWPELAEQPGISGERVALGELTLREVDRAMQALPEEQRLVISLVTVEGMSYREAAEVLEVPIGTVMSRLARGRAVLAHMFAGAVPNGEAGNE
jgi:RNA polymerase sigma-70 factor (ECF subfamily)